MFGVCRGLGFRVGGLRGLVFGVCRGLGELIRA